MGMADLLRKAEKEADRLAGEAEEVCNGIGSIAENEGTDPVDAKRASNVFVHGLIGRLLKKVQP